MGTAIAVARAVTIIVDRKKGRMPNVGGSETGYHLVPKKNCQGGEYLNIGNPSLARMAIIPSSTTTVESPARKSAASITFSPKRNRRFRSIAEAAVVLWMRSATVLLVDNYLLLLQWNVAYFCHLFLSFVRETVIDECFD